MKEYSFDCRSFSICPLKGGSDQRGLGGRMETPPGGLHASELLLKDAELGPSPPDDEQESCPSPWKAARGAAGPGPCHTAAQHTKARPSEQRFCATQATVPGAGEPAHGLSAADPGSLGSNRGQTQGREEDQSKVRLATTLLSLHGASFFHQVLWRHYLTRLFTFFI